MARLLRFCNLAALLTLFVATLTSSQPTCIVKAHGNGRDDTPAIMSAFSDCDNGGRIIFAPNTTYYVNTVMNTTALSDVHIDLHGYLLWSSNITYWLENSLLVGYQNQSSAWFLGGTNLTIDGHGTGTLDGNGQAWYDFVKGESNYPGRPMGLTIWGANHSRFEGLRFVQSQMWTMAIIYSHDLLLQDIYVNSTSLNGNPARNTDGADVLYSNDVTMRRWEIDNGDDGISLKGNSTNVLIEDCIFRTGQGFALGSIGQYADRFEVIEDVIVRNVTCVETKYAAYVKTWTGEQAGYPPNGGGGGTGRKTVVHNIEKTYADGNVQVSATLRLQISQWIAAVLLPLR